MSEWSELEHLARALAINWPTRVMERSAAVGITCAVVPAGTTVEVGNCWPPRRLIQVQVLVIAAQPTADGAVGVLKVRPDVERVCYNAGWTVLGSEPDNIDDRPAELIKLEKRTV